MQKVVFSEMPVQGPGRHEISLPQPEAFAGFYRDIAVLAVPATPTKTVARKQVLNVTAKFKDGRLAWDVPEGCVGGAPLRSHLDRGRQRLGAASRPRLGVRQTQQRSPRRAFQSLHSQAYRRRRSTRSENVVSTHIDSWEVGGQNWTPRFREEFQRLRGYDPLPLLPILAGRVLDDQEVTDRFQNDMRQTVTDLGVTNYAGHLRELPTGTDCGSRSRLMTGLRLTR